MGEKRDTRGGPLTGGERRPPNPPESPKKRPLAPVLAGPVNLRDTEKSEDVKIAVETVLLLLPSSYSSTGGASAMGGGGISLAGSREMFPGILGAALDCLRLERGKIEFNGPAIEDSAQRPLRKPADSSGVVDPPLSATEGILVEERGGGQGAVSTPLTVAALSLNAVKLPRAFIVDPSFTSFSFIESEAVEIWTAT